MHQRFALFFLCVPKRTRIHGLRVGNSVERILIRQLCNGVERREKAVLFRAVGRIRAGRQRRPRFSSVRKRSRVFAVNDVGRNREDRRGRLRIAVGVVFAELLHERFQEPHGNFVGAVVVVAVTREIAVDFEVHRHTVFIADGRDFRVFNGRKRIDHMREACDSGCKRPSDVGVDQRHFCRFIVIPVVHVLNQVQHVHIESREPVHHDVVFRHHVVVVKHRRK